MDKVSVIIPCYNEELFIAKCLDSIIASDWPKDCLEILVVDGLSSDNTVKIAERYCQQFSFIKLLHNPKRLTPSALNIGICNSTGNIIVRLDAHARYTADYFSKCVSALKRYGADNVGGVIHTLPCNDTLIAKAISLSLAHPFGVGSSHFRHARANIEYREVDTVPFGCFQRSLIDKIGLFNENLPIWKGRCNEDLDFNKRILAIGGKILLFPHIFSYYYARGSFSEFLKHNFNNGVLITLPLGDGHSCASLRHFIPMVFLLTMAALFFLAFVHSSFFISLLAVLSVYFALCLYFSFKTVLRQKKLIYFLLMPLVFVGLHLSYGLGSLYGLVINLCSLLSKKRQPVWR